MRFAFIHTADWQIGKRFGAFAAEKAAVLRDQRLGAVDRLAAAARTAGASAVLVAGDVFDSETVSDELAGRLLSRLKAYPKLTWQLLPGNHDPARAGGVWEAIVAAGLPGNVRVHLAPQPLELAKGVVLLPAPLTSKSTSRDPTAWMDGAPSPSGTIRIGLAHGSVQGFGSEGEADVPIDPARAKSAGLSYLALGDWHGATRISDRVWYSGTPEPDRFPDNEPGYALAVQFSGAKAVPQVERVPTAHFTWVQRAHTLESAEGLRPIEKEVGRLGADAARTLMQLSLEGSVSLAEFARIEERLTKLGPQLFHLQPNLKGLHAFAAQSDLEELNSGVLGTVASRLKDMADGGGEDAAVAAHALRKLFALARRAQAGGLVKIRAIRLREVGRFSEPVALEGLTGGLDVLAGPNELGKSTILKALNLALFEQHTSKAKKLEAFRPYSGGAPLVEVDFEIDGKPWRIRKQFLSGRAAELKDLQSGSVARGGDAEAQLSQLLSGAGRFALLWVDQGTPMAPLTPAATAGTALTATIEAEVETVADGGTARVVQAKIRQELAELVTGHNPPRPTGVYKTALDERQVLERNRDAAHERLRHAQARLDSLEDVRAQAGKLSDPLATAARAQAVAAASVALEEARAAREKCRRAEEDLQAHQERLQSRTAALESLKGHIADLAKLEEAAGREAPMTNDLVGRVAAGEARIGEFRGRREEIKIALVAAERDRKALEFAERLRQMDERLELARAASAECKMLTDELAGNRAEEGLVVAARREASSVTTIEARLSAAAPKVSVSYARGGKTKIKVGGRPLKEGETLKPDQQIALEIEGVGVVTIAPGQSESRAEDQADRAAHRKELRALLASARVELVDEAEQRLAERRGIENKLNEAGARLKALVPDGLERLERARSQIAAQVAPEGAVCEHMPAELEVRAHDLVEELADAEARLSEAEREHNQLGKEQVRLSTRADERAERIAALLARLGGESARKAELEKKITEAASAEAALNGAVRDLAAWREKAPDDTGFAQLRKAVEAAEAAKSRDERELVELRRTEAGLEGELKADRADDVAACVVELDEAFAIADARVQGLAEDVRALQLLESELEAGETEMRNRFAKPVMDRLGPYLQMVFPEARLGFGDGFSLKELKRANGVEALANLSEGTQEQLAVLVRLGFGQLLAETGSPVPVILDDALVYSDDERIERMFSALTRAAQSHQVLVLTCRERTFAGLGGHRITIDAWRES